MDRYRQRVHYDKSITTGYHLREYNEFLIILHLFTTHKERDHILRHLDQKLNRNRILVLPHWSHYDERERLGVREEGLSLP